MPKVYKNAESADASKRYWANREVRLAQVKALWKSKTAAQKYENRLQRYGLTFEQYAALLESQGGLCAMPDCRKDISNDTTAGRHLDHDHVTGRIRGVLCRKCNHALGRYEKSQRRAVVFAKYLAGMEN